nr:MAG TPA: hypothetical protein [Caudoviricetes sp.]
MPLPSSLLEFRLNKLQFELLLELLLIYLRQLFCTHNI